MIEVKNKNKLTPFDIFHLGVALGGARCDRWYNELFGEVPDCVINANAPEEWLMYESICQNISKYVTDVLFSDDGEYSQNKCGPRVLYEMFIEPVVKESWEQRVQTMKQNECGFEGEA